jgi:hypothetical protein
MSRSVSIAEFLKNDEVKRAARLYADCERGEFAKRCADEIIAPVLPRINETLGQENDPKYLAYMVEYTFMRTGVARKE